MARFSRLVVFFALAVAAAPARGQDRPSPAEAEYEARLIEAKGEVCVFTAEYPEGGPGAADMPLIAGDRVRTGPDSSAEIGLSGEHFIFLRSNSEFSMASAKRADAELGLSWGGLLAKIAALAGGGLRVRTPAAVAAVRGTEFAVETSSGSGAETHVGVFDEGKVEVRSEQGEPELLRASQETMVLRGGRPRPPYQLKRLARHRRFMRDFRRRAALLRRKWRGLPPERRSELRRKILDRMRELRRQRLERGQSPRARPRPDQGLRQDQKKMRERKNAIRERRGRPRP